MHTSHAELFENVCGDFSFEVTWHQCLILSPSFHFGELSLHPCVQVWWELILVGTFHRLHYKVAKVLINQEDF